MTVTLVQLRVEEEFAPKTSVRGSNVMWVVLYPSDDKKEGKSQKEEEALRTHV
jgi:hypothetical protein